MTTGIVLILLSYLVHDLAKAIGDGILFGWKYDLPLVPDWVREWVMRKPQNPGKILKADLWHFCEGHVRELTIGVGSIGGFLVGFNFPRIYPFAETFVLFVIVFVSVNWVGYWLGGRLQTFVFHVLLVKDWTFRFWIDDTININDAGIK